MHQQSRNFMNLLHQQWSKGNTISVGLDGEPDRLPEKLRHLDALAAVVEFHKQIIKATSHLAAAYKPQIASYEAMGPEGVIALIETIDAVHELAPETPVIVDAKRADIGTTNEKYADAIFGIYGADAVTVNPYLGPEAMQPFLEYEDKGIIILCHTSNPGSARYQELLVDGVPLYQYIAKDVAESWNANGNCGLVVGATYPEQLQEVRNIVGTMPILIPGIGAQGGDIEATVKAGLDKNGQGMIIHASRSLMYAYENSASQDVEQATSEAITTLHNQINSAKASISKASI